MSRPTLGFVGLGNMGRPMAGHLVAAGFEVVGFDRAGSEARLPAGASAASSVADVAARADTMLLSVPEGAATAAVVAEVLAAPTRRVGTVVDLSTIGPGAAVAAAGRLGAAGVTYCDGPVSGGVAGAVAATVSCMFAGPAPVFDAHRSVLGAFAGNVFHVGEQPGQGQAMKLVNNFLSATALVATSEALSFGVSAGLELRTMVDVLNVSSGRNTATSDKFPNRVIPGTYDAGFAMALMTKDVVLYHDAVVASGRRHDVADAVTAVWRAAAGAMPAADFSEVWRFVHPGP